jgi:predicted DNA-binding transcriptional regulator AlpA
MEAEMHRERALNSIKVDRDQMLIGSQVLAKELQVSLGTINNWVRSKILPKPIKIGKSNRWLWSDIKIWLTAREQARMKQLAPLATDPDMLRRMAERSIDPSLGGRGKRRPRRGPGRPRKIQESEK